MTRITIDIDTTEAKRKLEELLALVRELDARTPPAIKKLMSTDDAAKAIQHAFDEANRKAEK